MEGQALPAPPRRVRDLLPAGTEAWDVGRSGDGEGDDGYEDVRLELRATGHNLTSVLMNPRESLMDELTDEFISDQAQPLDLPYVHVKASSLSTHSSHHSHHPGVGGDAGLESTHGGSYSLHGG